MAHLLAAKFSVRFVALGRWRSSLGSVCGPGSSIPYAEDEGAEREAARLGRAVVRATARLPGDTKCLPQAVALQWMLRRRGIGARLVIAVALSEHAVHNDGHHAWVERNGQMLVGHCKRSAYRPLMVLESGDAERLHPFDHTD